MENTIEKAKEIKGIVAEVPYKLETFIIRVRYFQNERLNHIDLEVETIPLYIFVMQLKKGDRFVLKGVLDKQNDLKMRLVNISYQ